jgi:glycosyltransferase involved in cell wall biosynthesis
MKDVRAEEGMTGLKKHMSAHRNKSIDPLKVEVGYSSFLAFRPWMTWPNNFLSEGMAYSMLGAWNDKRMSSYLRSIVKQFSLKDYLFINAMDPFFLKEIPQDIRPKHKIYYSLDNISEVEYTARHGSRLEAEQVKAADLVLATSTELKKKMEQWREEVYLLPNAVDFEHSHKATSSSQEVAAELRDIEVPIIGYVGSLEYRVDAEIMESVLQNHPDKVLVVIGPVLREHFPIEKLEKYDNLLYLGPKKYEELPSYIKAFSCGIIPFKKTGVTRSIYPLKVNEYLAAGLPVVATSFSEDIQGFGDLVQLAEEGESFSAAVTNAVQKRKTEDPSQRYNMAKDNTWEVRINRLWQILGEEH